jgi:hypothetical protein
MDHLLFQPTGERPGASAIGSLAGRVVLRLRQTALEAAPGASGAGGGGGVEHGVFLPMRAANQASR